MCRLRRIGKGQAPVGVGEADGADSRRVDLRQLAWDDMLASGKGQTRRKARPPRPLWSRMS